MNIQFIKLLTPLLDAAAAATKSSCEAGAIGAGVGEIVAGLMPEPANGIEYTDAEN